jgi:alpha-L-arabinofuranosidase
MRSAGFNGTVTVALQSEDGRMTYASSKLDVASREWKKFAFLLKSNASDAHARFSIWFDEPGTLWIDQVVLLGMGNEQFAGLPIRADIVRMLQWEGVKFLRYGGTMVNAPGYKWKKMIGDPDKRSPYDGHWYPYSTNGFGIFDFLNFCDSAHIEAAFAINIEESNQDAADLADYLTAPISNRWGKQRALDGHPVPYTVRYIEVGNEEVIGDDSASGYGHYAERFKSIANAIHSRNPNIPLVCAAWWRPDSPNMRSVFNAVNGLASAWDLHVWSDSAKSGLDIDRQITQMRDLFKSWDPNTGLKAVVFEENGNLHNLQRALGHGTTLNATLRHSDFVAADCPANCLQPLGENDNGWDQGQIFFTPDQVWGMPPYYAQQMASAAAEPIVVDTECSSPQDDLDVTAIRSKDGGILNVMVVNAGRTPHTARLYFDNFTPASIAQLLTLTGMPNDENTSSKPRNVIPNSSSLHIDGSTFLETFPPYSYTVVELRSK